MLLKISFLFLIQLQTFAIEKKKISPKVPIHTLKLFNIQEDYSFFQTSDNSLKFKKGLGTKTIFQAKRNQHFTMQLSSNLALIVQDENFNAFQKVGKNKNIFIINKDGSNLRKIGIGQSAKIHSSGEYVSIVSNGNIEIYLTKSLRKILTLNYTKGFDKYFIPEVSVRSSGDFYFTEIDQNQKERIIFYSQKKSERQVFYTASSIHYRLQFCFDPFESIFIKVSKKEKIAQKSYILDSNFLKIFSTDENFYGRFAYIDKGIVFSTKDGDSFKIQYYFESKIKLIHEAKQVLNLYHQNIFIADEKVYQL